MSAPIAPPKTLAARLRGRVAGLRGSRRARRLALIAAGAVLLYALLGFFAMPALLHHYVDTRAGALLGRPLSVGTLRFNPFTLKLVADQLHVGDADGKAAFVDVDQLTLNASWMSLFRLAPVLDEVVVQHPRIAVTRTAAQRFNFSDLVERFSTASTPPGPNAKPARFSLSNIALHAGEIRFDDRVENASHHLERIEVGIPFLANLPRDVDVFVQPLLAMTVDGSPLRMEGQTKPFADSLESTIDFHLDRLDLPRYLGYVPVELPIAIPRGLLSGELRLRFVQDKAAAQLGLGGTLALDDFALTARDATPIAEIGHASATLGDVQPLAGRYGFGGMRLERAALRYVRKANGRSNLDVFGSADKPAQDKAPASEVSIAKLDLVAGRFDYVDESLGDPAAMITIEDIAGSLSGLDTRSGPAAAVDVKAVHNGGQLATTGKLDVAASHYAGTLNAKDVGLPPLQPFVRASGTRAVIQQGRFASTGTFFADWKEAFNLHIEPATATLSDVAIGLEGGKGSLIAWSALDLALTHFDLAAREAQHGDVSLRGLRLNAQRGRDGRFDLANLAGSGAATSKAVAASPAWHWSIARLAFDDAAVNLKDLTTPKPIEVAVKSIQGEVSGLSEDLKPPLKLLLGAAIGKGKLDVKGTIKPASLDADLRIRTSELDIAGLAAYADMPLNMRVLSARLSADGALRYVDGRTPKLAWRGRVALGRVRVQDKLTNEEFVRFRLLDVGAIEYTQDAGPMRLKLGDTALSDFYARVIMSADGRLNVSGITSSSTTASAPPGQEPTTAATPPTMPPRETNATAAPAASIDVGQVTLTGGQLNYTDLFIQPSYSANITQFSGKIGAFGSGGGEPADVTVQGQLDDNARVDIDGRINPLAAVAYVDIKGKANGVELTHLSAYSSKYTGYPIVKGRLNADVSYLLDHGQLKAENHINIDQLTFGDRIESPGVSHLPVKLAVALLKDSNGVIDVNVPVSGSLDDPQFSLGGVIWRAFGGLIAKAATAPFRLLASAFKGGGEAQELSYVEFAPGSAVLDGAAKDRLTRIVTAMNERPSVNLDIIGRVDPAQDEDGLRKVMVDELIERGRRDDLGDKAGAADELPPPTPEDTERYLERAYKQADFPKDRNLIGLTKAQPAEDMRKLLEAHMRVDDIALHQLADRRASVVRAFLSGKTDDKRLFLAAPKYDAEGIDDHGKTTRAEFGLH
ncbi:MAG: DUF748 domain-containing protein [Dokdonella sp.]